MFSPASTGAARLLSPPTTRGVRRVIGGLLPLPLLPTLLPTLLLPILLPVILPVAAAGQSLSGSPQSLGVQTESAHAHDFTYLADASQLRRFVNAGYLVRVQASANLELNGVSYPVARPQVRLFLDRLSRQYRQACGQPLVVTSLTRPLSAQPANASSQSVHPTGMAVDIRRSTDGSCRDWIERVLLSLERGGVLEATKEQDPPHYHVAVFPQPYARYVTRLAQGRAATAAPRAYRVRAGDSLWQIAQHFDTSVGDLKAENDLESSRIVPGQILKIPAGE